MSVITLTAMLKMNSIECRYFIIIDDIWNEQDWKLIEASFPDNNIGSRIIATTCIISVTNMCCSNSSQTYKIPPIDDVDSSVCLPFMFTYPCDDDDAKSVIQARFVE